ncbi:unnamed protein product [Cylindrotheca closterium]|uniref:Uncharacterized protein n=1 Tax=Cylindrotheca closterium TaxID=2856 RepID=A0AAD2G8X2_9STRA|nr:unnamed protein product [Cylindrotheca closterium]
MTSIHHDIAFRKEGMLNGNATDAKTTTTTTTSHQMAHLASGQFAFVEGDLKNTTTATDGNLADKRTNQSARRLLGNNLYSSFRKKSKVMERITTSTRLASKNNVNNVESEVPVVAPEGIAFIPSQISLRPGSLISDLNTAASETSKRSKNPLGELQQVDPIIRHPQSQIRHVPARRPKRQSSFGTMAPEPPKLKELIEDSGILNEITMQKGGGGFQSIVDAEGLDESSSDWRQLSKKTQRAVSAVLESTLHEVLSLEDHPSYYSSTSPNDRVVSGQLASNASGSTNEWRSFGDTTISSRSLDHEELQHMKERKQRASSEPDSESSRPLPNNLNEQEDHSYRIRNRQWEEMEQQEQVAESQYDISRSLSISSRYEPAVSPIPDGVELDVLPRELDDGNTLLKSQHRRVASDDLVGSSSNFLLSEEQLHYLNRKDSTQSMVSEITMDTNVKTSGRSILTTPPATPMVLDPRAPQLLMARLQEDPTSQINTFPRPPIALESPTPPMRKRSPDDDHVIDGTAARFAERSSGVTSALQPYTRKGTLTQSGRAQQLHEMEAILENEEKVKQEGISARKKSQTDNSETTDSDLDTEELSTSESFDPQPISLRGPFASDSDAMPIRLGGLLRPVDNSNPLLFPAPLISDDEDEEHFQNESDHQRAIDQGKVISPSKSKIREQFSAVTATPSVDNRRKFLPDVFVASNHRKDFQNSHRDIVFDSSNSSIDLEAETAPLHDAIVANDKVGSSIQRHSESYRAKSGAANRMEPSSSVGQFNSLHAKSAFEYPKPPSHAPLHSSLDFHGSGDMPEQATQAKSVHSEENIDELSTSESADPPPAISLRGPFADDSEAAPRRLGGLLRPQEDSNPLLFPAPLMSDDEDAVCFEDEPDAETFSGPVDAMATQKEMAGESKRPSSLKDYQLKVFNPSANTRSTDNQRTYQNTTARAHRDILFDSSTHSMHSGEDTQEPNQSKQSNNNDNDNWAGDEILPLASKIESSVLTNGEVNEQFCFRGLQDGVRVKLCPAQIGYLLNGKAHVHSGHYSGPLNSQCRMHGNGMFWFTSGDTYLGEFRNGELHGAGMMSVTDEETGKKQVFSGYFSRNKYVGDEVVDDDST